MPQVIKLTNRKKIPMSVPNGEGGLVELAPGETKLVTGEFEYFHRMPTQGMNGLVVKIAEGEKVRLVEGIQKQDFVRATITNHRNIPMRLATGIGQKSLEIAAKSTSEPTMVRLSVVKQMSGISVHPIKDDDQSDKKPAAKKDEPPVDTKPADEKPADDPADDGPKVEAPGGLKNGADAEAIAEAVKRDEALLKRRRELTLPDTNVEWEIHKEQLTWPDVRGIAKELDIKTSNLKKHELLEEITKTLYPS